MKREVLIVSDRNEAPVYLYIWNKSGTKIRMVKFKRGYCTATAWDSFDEIKDFFRGKTQFKCKVKVSK